jgi:glycosyltransferase involved in cell wall biosynthesis
MQVSVILITDNNAELLPRTLNTLRAQTLAGFELIVLDNASETRHWQAVQTLRWPRLRIHRCASHLGEGELLNQGAGLADGRYLVFHTAGDISMPERLTRQVALLDRREEVAAVGAAVEWVTADGRVLHTIAPPSQHVSIMKRLAEDSVLPAGAVMIRRTAWDAAGGCRPPFAHAAVYDLLLRLGQQYRLGMLKETLYKSLFTSDLPLVVDHAERLAYENLARQLHSERGADGTEATDLAGDAAALAAASGRIQGAVRRQHRARNYLLWAELLESWGQAGAAEARSLRRRARTIWPFDRAVWRAESGGFPPLPNG